MLVEPQECWEGSKSNLTRMGRVLLLPKLHSTIKRLVTCSAVSDDDVPSAGRKATEEVDWDKCTCVKLRQTDL